MVLVGLRFRQPDTISRCAGSGARGEGEHAPSTIPHLRHTVLAISGQESYVRESLRDRQQFTHRSAARAMRTLRSTPGLNSQSLLQLSLAGLFSHGATRVPPPYIIRIRYLLFPKYPRQDSNLLPSAKKADALFLKSVRGTVIALQQLAASPTPMSRGKSGALFSEVFITVSVIPWATIRFARLMMTYKVTLTAPDFQLKTLPAIGRILLILI